MSNVKLTSSMRSNLLSLQSTAKQQNIIQNRLASGLKVSTAIDNPSSYYTAQSLHNRAADLGALLDSMGQAVQIIKTANDTLQRAASFLQQASSTASSALDAAVVPDKLNIDAEWLKSQGVAAQDIITDKDQLLNRLTTVTTGDRLVIFANIDMGDAMVSVPKDITICGAEAVIREAGMESTRGVSKENQAQLVFNFNDANNAIGILAQEDLTISDLNIDYYTEYKTSTNNTQDVYQYSAITSRGSKLNLNNVDLKVRTGNNGNMASAIFMLKTGSNLNLDGLINVDLETTTRVTMNSSYYLFDMNQTAKSTLNVKSSSGAGVFSGNFNSHGIVNLYNCGANFRILNQYGTMNIYNENGGGISSQLLANLYGEVNIWSQGGIGSGHSGYIETNVYGKLNVKQEWYAYGRAISAKINFKSGSESYIYGGYQTFNTAFDFEAGSKIGISRAGVSDVWLANQSGTSSVIPVDTLAGISEFRSLGTTPPPFPDMNEIISKAWDEGKKTAAGGDKEGKSNEYYIPEQYAKVYNGILMQYEMLIKDSSYKGINLLQQSNLKINFNEDRSSSIEVKGIDASAKALGLREVEWKNPADIAESLTEIESSLAKIRDYAASFGNYYSLTSTREEFTKNLINVLSEGADKLTLADMNEESANMLALQTRQELAVNSLSLASVASQSVLRLF